MAESAMSSVADESSESADNAALGFIAGFDRSVVDRRIGCGRGVACGRRCSQRSGRDQPGSDWAYTGDLAAAVRSVRPLCSHMAAFAGRSV